MGTNLDEYLQAYKNEHRSEAKAAPMRSDNTPVARPSNMFISESVDNLDNLVFGKPDDTPMPGVYSPEREMELIKSGYKGVQVNKGRLASEILNEVINNPIDPTPLAVDTAVDELAGRVAGIKKTNDILQKLEEEDKAKAEKRIMEQRQAMPRPSAGSIDYSLIKSIVESAIDEKLSKLNISSLNEGVSRQSSPDLMVIRQTSDGKTLFIDSENNVYECKMVPTGKKVNFRKK